MAELKGGTTIAGYTAIHSGLREVKLSGNITVTQLDRSTIFKLQSFYPDNELVFMMEDSIGSIRTPIELSIMSDNISITANQDLLLYSSGALTLRGTTITANGNIRWNNGADDLDSLKSSVSSGKNSIAAAITGKGISASGTETHGALATKISNISQGDPIYRITPNNTFTSADPQLGGFAGDSAQVARGIHVSPSGKYIAVGKDGDYAASDQYGFAIYKRDGFGFSMTQNYITGAHSSWIKWINDRELVFAYGYHVAVMQFNPDTGVVVPGITIMHGGGTTYTEQHTVDISSNGRWIVITDNRNLYVYFYYRTGPSSWTLAYQHYLGVAGNAVEFAPNSIDCFVASGKTLYRYKITGHTTVAYQGTHGAYTIPDAVNGSMTETQNLRSISFDNRDTGYFVVASGKYINLFFFNGISTVTHYGYYDIGQYYMLGESDIDWRPGADDIMFAYRSDVRVAMFKRIGNTIVKQTTITFPGGYAQGVSWAPSGNWFAYSTKSGGSYASKLNGNPGTLIGHEVDGEEYLKPMMRLGYL